MQSQLATKEFDGAWESLQLFQGNILQLLPQRRPAGKRATKCDPEPEPVLAAAPTPERLSRDTGTSFARPIHVPKRTVGRRCSCGTCPSCVDNARWDAIFNAKFADATYYERRMPRMGSTLSQVS